MKKKVLKNKFYVKYNYKYTNTIAFFGQYHKIFKSWQITLDYSKINGKIYLALINKEC